VAEEVAADSAAAEEHDRQDRLRRRRLHLDSRIGFDSSRLVQRDQLLTACWSVRSAGRSLFGCSVQVWAVPPKSLSSVTGPARGEWRSLHKTVVAEI
jgi:hypothetical protein